MSYTQFLNSGDDPYLWIAYYERMKDDEKQKEDMDRAVELSQTPLKVLNGHN